MNTNVPPLSQPSRPGSTAGKSACRVPDRVPGHVNDHGITVRRVSGLREYDECVRIERETWGDQFTELVSATVLRISQEVGGVTAAAFDPDGRMLGFVFGMTGIRDGELAHWSDMLAVRPEAQHLGIGTRLKHYQRELLLEIGVGRMYWTYDPLVSRNAHLNLVRLGARVAEYKVNYYGEDTGSVIHAGLGTDRFILTWDLVPRSDVPATFRPLPADTPLVNSMQPGTGIPAIHDLPDSPMVRVAIPKDIFAELARDPVAAHAWRDTTRRAFCHYLGAGYTVLTFERDSTNEGGTYYLQHTEPRTDLNPSTRA
ncbi:MAG: hypothetical protein ACR2MQ_05425 [Gemmatimonadaceae bacterium]